MIKNFFNANKEYFLIVVLFFLIAGIYFMPALNGYSLLQGDVSNHRGMAKELMDYREMYGDEAIWTNSMFGGMPGYQISVAYQNGFTWLKRLFFSAVPHPISYFVLAFLCFFVLSHALKIDKWIGVLGSLSYGFMTYNIVIVEAGHNTKMIAIALFPAMLGALFRVYRDKKVILPLALFSFFFALELSANHIQMTYYFGFVVLGVVITELIAFFKAKNLLVFFKRSALLLVALIIAVGANFSNYYFTYTYGKKTIRGPSELTIQQEKAVVKDENKSSGLDRDYIVQWCYGKQETYNLLIPNAKGSNYLITEYFDYLKGESPQMYNYCVQQYQNSGGKLFAGYWGDQPFTSGPNYVGAIVVLLALLYVLFVSTRLKWALFSVTLLAILLSWGKNLGGSVEHMWLTNFFIDYVPLYSKFRAVSSILVIVNFTLPFMAMLFVNELLTKKEWAKNNLKKFGIAGGSIIGVVFFVAYLFPGVLDYTSNQEELLFDNLYQSFTQSPGGINPLDARETLVDFRIEVLQKDSLRAIGFMLGALLIILGLVAGKLKYKFAIPLLLILGLLDIWNVDRRYLSNDKKSKNSKSYLAWEKSTAKQHTFDANPGDLQIYGIEASQNPKIEEAVNLQVSKKKKERRKRLSKREQEGIQFAALNFNTNYRVLNIDNPFNDARTSYFHKSSGGYHGAKLRKYQELIDFYLAKELQSLREPQKMKVFNMLNTKYYLYQGNLAFMNPYAYGNAWFVDDIKWVANADEEIKAIEDTDVRTTAIVDHKFKDCFTNVQPQQDSSASIILNSYLPNHLTYQSSSSTDQVAVFSEIYFKDGWQAYIDGQEVDHAKANYVLRTLPIPAGKHTVEFKFKPAMFDAANMINLVCFFVIVLGILFASIKYNKQ